MEQALYRIKDWDRRFESAKSREYKMKSQTYMPNKVGIGYVRIMRELDGAAIYGAWCAVVGLLSRMEGPRHGYLTDTGRATGTAHDSASLGMLTLIHKDIVQRMLILCSSKDIGWLEVMSATDTAKDTAGILPGIAGGPLPLPLPSPLPVKSVRKGDGFDRRTGDKYEQIQSIPQADLADWAVSYCGDALEWTRVYKEYIQKIGPEAFRSILAQFVGEIDAGEGCRNRGSALVAKLKDAVAAKSRKAVFK